MTATFQWDRLDVLPRGTRPNTFVADSISLWMEGVPAVGDLRLETLRDGRQDFQVFHSTTITTGGVVTDLFPAQEWRDSDFDHVTPDSSTGYQLGSSIALDKIEAGQPYVITFDTQPEVAATAIDRVIVTYDHLGVFGSRAILACDSSADGVTIDPPFRLP